MLCDDPPTMSYYLSDDRVGTDWLEFTPPAALSNATIKINEKKLYDKMTEKGIGSVTLVTEPRFLKRSTSEESTGMVYKNIGGTEYLVKQKTFTFYRSVFELGDAEIVNPASYYSPRTDFYYLNNQKHTVGINISPTSIHCGVISETEKRSIANNFRCTSAALYLGNNTNPSNKLYDLDLSMDIVRGADGKINFICDVPPDKQGSPNDGIRLQLDGVSSVHNGKTYVLQDGSTSIYFYFPKFKVDTKAPTIRLTNVNGTDIPIQNSIRNEHNFYFVSSEILYPDKNAPHTSQNERYLRYELYQKSGGVYGSSPVPITGYLGTGKQTQVQAPVSTSVIQDAMITLKTADPVEGQFKLRIYGYDDANNGLYGNDYFEIENIYLDRKAPRVQLTEIVQNQAPDGIKRNDYRFDIEDLQENRQFGSWARTYYCFVEEGQEVPDPASQNIEPVTGEIDVVTGKWAFVEGGTETTTAVLRVPRGETFKGTLYYYTRDSCNNDSRIEQKGNSRALGKPCQYPL
ncbi:MAG TPA: hypothetical protein GXX36_06410 [Clostridiaceae bacterium]|nr:hypothetical protein [Clostridiaceae bacterium]